MTGKLTLMALSLLWVIAASAGTSTAATTAQDLPLNKIHLPPGFEISLFAKVPNARSMTLGRMHAFRRHAQRRQRLRDCDPRRSKSGQKAGSSSRADSTSLRAWRSETARSTSAK